MNIINIGVLKEDIDKRAIFIPRDLKLLSSQFSIAVEENIGINIGYSNEDYIEAGVSIETKQNIWNNSDILFKYKKPSIEDIDTYGENKTIFSLLHPEGNIEMVKKMLEKNVTSYSFEYFKQDNIFPLAYVGGQIAGKMAIFYANHFLQSQYGGLGKSLFSIDGADRSHVLVIGHGHVGRSAISEAVKLGCKVTVLGKSFFKFRKESMYLDSDIDFITEDMLTDILPYADVIIGAILISVDSTPAILSSEKMLLIKKNAVIIDVTCGYGKGYLPDLFSPTTLDHPIKYTKTGQIYCKIDNLPSAYPLSTSQAYSSQISKVIPYIVNHLYGNTFSKFIESGKITENGKIIHTGVKKDLELMKDD